MAERELFFLSAAVESDPDTEEWLGGREGELGDIARRWFRYIRSCGRDVRELLHDGCPTACVKGAAFAYVNVFRSHVNVGFFHGASLPDPAGLLEGDGKHMRHVKLRPGVAPDAATLEALIVAAYRDVRRRLAQAGR
jgi:hypothetical protein